ncbi:CusA/CzcA family heavy metal efflux RND transporter [Luteibacter sp. 329MFSha]|uniref:efflux RND transporter permease subunit n=1 Tax=Luteibacter sp. 329MFSha TaxID=1798239 RepID=UPI0008CDAB72|nr:CusA/CzcA family heavy metal efflux RND transporter [Luteibacter sp. 329MFSha]SEV94177.1 cobalt-zinc-cadmium resistance protein CzcA [Luteibacter sp. 329MFSha]
MLAWIVERSLKYRLLVILAFLAIAALGIRAAMTLPIDAFPDVTPVQVNVYTEAPGLAAEDVEQLLTTPVESALAGLPSVAEIRSVSLFGLSYVAVYFDDDIDVYFARQLVNERLQQVGDRLPAGYGKPEMGPNTSGLGQVFWYTVERADESLKGAPDDMDLRTLQDWTVRLVLRTAAGVDDVTSWGGRQKQFQVRIDPLRLIAHELGFRDVMQALEANNAQVGGNFIDVGREQYLVRGLGLVRDANDIGAIVLKTEDGTPVRVRDVATVTEAGAPRTGAVTRDGKEVVMGQALARIGENARTVVDAVKARLDVVQRALPAGVAIRPAYERTGLVDAAVGTAVRALVEGSILVAVVLFLFLGELRSALIVVVTLPFAMLIAFIGMAQAGLSANLMSLAGLAIAIGMMVDGAVVMVENAFRIMAEREARGEPADRTAAVLAAAREVAGPVTFAIVIIIVVFLPLFGLQGLEGKMFRPMALNIGFAMAGSLLLSLTLVPVLAALLLKPRAEKDTRLVDWLKRRYARLLGWALAHARTVAGVAVAALLGSLALFPFLGKEFMPELREGAIMWRITSIPSASLDESIDVSRRVAERIKARFPEVETTLAMIGRAEKGETADVNYMEVYTPLKPKDHWRDGQTLESIEEAMQAELTELLPTAAVSYTQPIQMRIEELMSGVRATLALKVYGDDLATLDRLSARIKDTLAGVPGVADLELEANVGKPQIRIAVNRDALSRYGLNTDDVLTVVRNGIGGEAIGALLDGVRRFDISVRLDDAARASLPAIERIPVRTPSGALVQLSQVADVDAAEGYSFIRREQLQRYAVIQMDVRGRDIDGFVREANARLESAVKLPPGYYTQWGGAFENQQRALKRLAIIVPVTIFFIFVLLYTAFHSLRHAGLILANVPFAIIGGIVGLYVTGQYLSVPSAIGFIAVFGVAMLNGIVLVSFFNEQRRDGASVRDAVLRGATLRLRPVLMTASVAILGLVPMLLSTGVGAETQRPLATVVVGGLITSTLLTLILLPVMYDALERRKGAG